MANRIKFEVDESLIETKYYFQKCKIIMYEVQVIITQNISTSSSSFWSAFSAFLVATSGSYGN